jgi:hypothetical protein
MEVVKVCFCIYNAYFFKGFSSVVKKKLWMRIGKKLGLNKTTCTSMSNQLRTAYERYILPFEKYSTLFKARY